MYIHHRQLPLMAALALATASFGASAPVGLRVRPMSFEGAPVLVLHVTSGAKILPVAGRPGKTVLEWARSRHAEAAINGGYFNHSDGFAVSAVRADGKPLTHPRRNRALLDNPVLRPLLGRIFEARSEWRALAGPQGIRWAIAPHDAPVAPPWRVVDSLQAGPSLLPAPALVDEGFVIERKGVVLHDGIGSASRAARSALGLDASGNMLLVVAARPGLTMTQLSGLMSRLGARRAMALDGGSSSAIAYRTRGGWRTFVGETTARVNSALLVMPQAPATHRR